MSVAQRQLLALGFALLVAGCGGAGEPGQSSAGNATDAGYIAPPQVRSVQRTTAGVSLGGVASPGAPVRLGAPSGEALSATADAQGRWRIEVPLAGAARIFGVSSVNAGRAVQGEGYLLVGPQGQAALLRSGAGAVRLDVRSRPGLDALDFDADGGALLSGRAAAGTDVAVRVDGRPVEGARAGQDGRFSIAVARFGPGPHRLEAAGVGFSDALSGDATPGGPLVDGPLRSQVTPQGLRADWLTPGGGVQTTILTP